VAFLWKSEANLMAFIYDNLTASVVSGMVILILFSVQMRATNSSVAQTGRNVALNQARTFATWLEQDLQRMGRNIPPGGQVFVPPSRKDTDASATDTTLSTEDAAFTFYYKNSPSSSGKTSVAYDIASETRDVGGTARTLYQLTRQRSGNEDGQSPPTLGYFDLQFVGANANRIDPKKASDQIRAIRVHFSVVPPFQNAETPLHEVHRMVVVPYTPAL
jgi:hypothetical protein